VARKRAARGGGGSRSTAKPPDRAKVPGDQLTFIEGQGISIRLRGVISTGCDALDVALGRGGIPQGRLTILSGADGCGKTTQALELVAEVQRRGGFAVYMDAEHKLDIPYAEKVGVDMDQLVVSKPTHLEGMLAVMERWCARAATWREQYGDDVPIAIILDSTNAATPKAEVEGDWDSMTVGLQSRLWSSKLPKLIGMAQRAGVALVFIGQLREKIGIMFGKKTSISGGRAIRHHATIHIEYTRKKTIKKPGTEKPTAILVGAKVEKNQIAMPFREAEFMIRLGYGFDREAELVEAAVDAGVVERKGGWHSYDGQQFGQSADQAAGYLRKAPEFADKIRAEVKAEATPELERDEDDKAQE